MEYIFLSTESESPASYFVSKILYEIRKKLFVLKATDYGNEIESIGIIPICVSKRMLTDGFCKEQKIVSKVKKEADIRLQIDYEEFLKANDYIRKLLIIDNIIKSIKVISLKSKSDFKGSELERDILNLLEITADEINLLHCHGIE